MYFRDYRLSKSLLENSLKSTVSEQALTCNMWNRRKYLLHFHENPFIMFFLLFWVNLIWNMSPLVLGEILGVFVNTLTADGKYPVQGCENLQHPIEMQLS